MDKQTLVEVAVDALLADGDVLIKKNIMFEVLEALEYDHQVMCIALPEDKNVRLYKMELPMVEIQHTRCTGIVRRIDDLGRIVIPREIRRSCKLGENAPMEIYTTMTGDVVLRKFEVVEDGK
jgi:hypothetical protein